MELNLDECKMAHESEVEWGLRKKFLVAHQDKFIGNKDRLFCLASCFINIEMYGNRYPDEVMVEVKELMSEIMDDVEDFRKMMHQRKDIQFVKEGEATSASKPGGKTSAYGNFVKSGDSTVKSSIPKNEGEVLKPRMSGLMAGFVKSNESFSSHNPTGGATMTDSAPTGGPTMSGQLPTTQVPETKPMDSTQSLSPELQSLLDKFYSLSGHLNSAKLKVNPQGNISISALHMAADKARMHITSAFEEKDGGFMCNMQIDSIEVASSSVCGQKKLSKTDAYEKAVTSLSKPYLSIKTVNPTKKELHASDYPFEDGTGGTLTKLGAGTRSNIRPLAGSQRGGFKQSLAGSQRGGFKQPPAGSQRGGFKQPPAGTQRGGFQQSQRGAKRRYDAQGSIYDNFYLLQPRNWNSAASGILHQSMEFSKQPLTWDFKNVSGGTACVITLHGTLIAEEVSDGRISAKKVASETALAHLREYCWTFQIKQSADSDEAGISRVEILGDESKKSEELPASNIGNKMMKLMGWSGGGIGKNQQGIKEPINVNTVINREGLGMMAEKGINKNFIPQIKSTIQNYARSEKEGDLVFASDLTKEERALVHSECKKLNLKSHSHGTGVERFLVVSRKRSVNQLFNMLQQQGGESSKYLLIPPGEGFPPEETQEGF